MVTIINTIMTINVRRYKYIEVTLTLVACEWQILQANDDGKTKKRKE